MIRILSGGFWIVSKGKGGEGKNKRKGPRGTHLNRVDNRSFSDEGEDVGNTVLELDKESEEVFPIAVVPDLDRNAPREGGFCVHGVEDVVKFPDLV